MTGCVIIWLSLVSVVACMNLRNCKCKFGSKWCGYLCQFPHGCIDFTSSPWDLKCCYQRTKIGHQFDSLFGPKKKKTSRNVSCAVPKNIDSTMGLLVIHGNTTLDDAVIACRNRSRELFTIDNQQKQDALAAFAWTTDCERIVVDTRRKGIFLDVWNHVNGTRANYFAWADGYPGGLAIFGSMSRKHCYLWSTDYKFDCAICDK